MARIYRMTEKAWELGIDWDVAIFNDWIETVKEFNTKEECIEYFDNELGSDSERYGIEL